MSKKLLFLFVFIVFGFVLLNIKYYEFEVSEKDIDSSLIGLTLDGTSTTNFPNKDSGYAIDSILCDKGATGVWDYSKWGLKIRNVTQSRTKCQINFVSRYSEGILNGTDPVLKEGLIPVMIENDGTVKKSSLGWEWYKYEDKKWANAVILNNETEVYYDGDIIPESAIESYFVWIPRYKYKIFDMGNYEGLTEVQNKPQIIDVQFGIDTTSDSDNSCKTPMESGASGNCSVGKYMTHPAFISFESIGMWVGKFETGYKGATTKEEAQKNENNPSKVQIKPDVYSWRGIQVANAHLSSYNYKRNLDSHMMKNTEWGAVAYLQHSKYGSHESVRINNNSDYKTGYGAVSEPTCSAQHFLDSCNQAGITNNVTQLWNTEVGVKASTTGNISGIYDMSGGAWEHMMSVMTSQYGIPCSGKDQNDNSGFNGTYCITNEFLINGIIDFPVNKKYYDAYQYGVLYTTYNRRILGDATGEMGPFNVDNYNRHLSSWYSDELWFVWNENPWVSRGARFIHGVGAGIFDGEPSAGNLNPNISFRVVLSF